MPQTGGLALCALLLAVGCGAHGAAGKQSSTTIAVPEELDARGYAQLVRAYRRLDPEDPQRAPLRARLTHYVLGNAEHAIAANEYEVAVESLAKIAKFYRPEELKDGLSPDLLPLANYLRKEGEPRGDEARVLSALWIQKSLHPNDPEPEEQYKQLRAFGEEARENLSISEHYSGLIAVLEEHARLTPAPEVLSTLAELYVERREKLLALARGREADDLRR